MPHERKQKVLSWINEEVPSDDEGWETTMLELNTCLFSSKIKSSLETPPRCSGHLEQASPSLFSNFLPCEDKFENKYCEIHGKYLAIYETDTDSKTSPSIVFNLKLMETVFISNYSLYIRHNHRNLQFRVSRSHPDDSSLSLWLSCLEKFVLDQRSQGGHHETGNIIKSNQTTLCDDEEQGNENCLNQLQKKSFDDTSMVIDGGGGGSSFEKSIRMRSPFTLTNKTSTTKANESDHNHIELFQIANPLSWNNSHTLSQNGKNGGMNPLLNMSDEISDNPIPPSFLWLLRLSGIIKNLKKSRCKLYFQRCLFIAAEVAVMYTVVRSLSEEPGCAQSINSNGSQYSPCLKIVSIYAVPLLSSSCAIVVYLWFIRHVKDTSIMFRSHRKRMYQKVEKFARYSKYCAFFVAYMMGCAQVIINPSNGDGNHVMGAIYSVIAIAVYANIFLFLIVPSVAFATLYYSESRRLRLLLKDFNLLLNKRPFHFFLISQAYIDLQEEWENANNRLGPIVSISAFVGLSNAIFMSVSILYSHLDILQMLLVFFLIFPVSMINVFSAISANNRAENLTEECDMLLAQLNLRDRNMGLEEEEDGSALETNVSMIANKSSSQRVVSGGGDSDGGVYAMRLAMLIDRKPCELRILGTKIEMKDIYSTILLILFVQVLNFLGVDLGIF